MSVSSTTTKNSYSGDGSTVAFAYGFRIFAAADLEVIIRSSTGTETTKTLTTHYSVSGVGEDAGGTVTFVTAPVTGETVVIRRNLTLTQGTDYVENDPFPANSHEDALDRLTFITQGIQEELDRAIKASKTNTISSVEFTISAADRANKIFAFDGSGDLSVTQELGTFRGNWATATSFSPRDIVKDTSNNNIYIANTAHTSSGSQPISSNADVAKWDLLVDAASATTSQTAAAASATAAASSATAAASSASASATSESNSASSASAAASSASSASSSATSASADLATFPGIFHGASASDPTTGLDAGDLYFNTSSNDLRVYNGSAWQVAAVSASGLLTAANNLSDLANAATARTNLGLVIGTDVQAFDSDTLFADVSDNLTAGFSSDFEAIGNSGTGTQTLEISSTKENLKTLTINGSFTLAPQTVNSVIALIATNDGTGGYTITTSGFDLVSGTYNNAASAKHLFRSTVIDGTQVLEILEIA